MPAQVCKSIQKHILSKSKFDDIFFPPFFKFYDEIYLHFFKFGMTFRKKNKFSEWLFRRLLMALLTIFLRLFCFAFCAVQNSSRAVQKSDYLF